MQMKTNQVRWWFERNGMSNIRGNTMEYRGICFEADKPYIFRPPNEDYVKAEIEWYKSQSLSVDRLAEIYGKRVKIWDIIADENNNINSNYGHLFLSEENGSQLSNVIKSLHKNPLSRQAVAIYNRPSIHSDATLYGKQDFICTNAVQYFIEDDELEAVVQMRSNDAVFGYNNDYAWQREAQTMVADSLQVGVGKMIWQVGSFHIYDRHWHLINEAGYK